MLGSLDASRIDLFWLVSSSQPIQNSTVSVLSSMVLGILGYLESPKLRSPHWTAPTAQLLLGKLASAMIFSTGSFRSPEQTTSHGLRTLDLIGVWLSRLLWVGKANYSRKPTANDESCHIAPTLRSHIFRPKWLQGVLGWKTLELASWQ
jgi:hypothetical protein